MALASGTAHGHVGQLTSSSVFESVGDVHSGTLRTVGGDGVGVRKFVAPDLVWAHAQRSTLRRASNESLRPQVDRGDHGALGGDPCSALPRCQRHDSVAGPVPTATGCHQLRTGELPQLVPGVPGSSVESFDAVTVVSDEEGLASRGHVVGP